MLHKSAILTTTCLTTTLAIAQPMASITVTANGGAAAIVQPGESVTIRTQLWQNQWSFAGAQGGTIVENHSGHASNFSTTLPSLPTMLLGSFQGGSRVNADLALTPPGFLGSPTWPTGVTTFPFWQYTLTLDEPGTYDIKWVAPPNAPNIRLYQTIASFTFIEAQSTYIGATITVVPAPGSLFLIACVAIARRRTRNTGRRP